MNDFLVSELTGLISTKLGLRVRQQDWNLLGHKVMMRVKALNLPSCEAYHQFLSSEYSSPAVEKEWRELIALLTVTESYFFRDQGQFWLLRHRILPDVIQRRRNLSDRHLCIRIWSAGCSTGEEIYSIAILLQELIPDWRAWNLLLLGTDLNPTALERAKRGLYNDWSFRSTSPEIRKRYFRKCQDEWELDPQIRSMVKFGWGNLLQPTLSECGQDMVNLDLILCRNVFIYFDAEAIAHVLQRFHAALAPWGYLLTGHTELHGQQIEPFKTYSYPESTVYQRDPSVTICPPIVSVSPVGSPASPTLPSLPLPPVTPHLVELTPIKSVAFASAKVIPQKAESLVSTLLIDLQQFISQKHYIKAIQTAKQVIEIEPRHFEAHCWMAEAYANLGDYANAMQSCQQAIKLNSLAVEPYYLLAQIFEEKNQIEDAKTMLKRIIYLAPQSVHAYLDLGSLYEREGNHSKAQKIWNTALNLLKQIPHESIVDAKRNLTAHELSTYLEKHLQKYSPSAFPKLNSSKNA